MKRWESIFIFVAFVTLSVVTIKLDSKVERAEQLLEDCKKETALDKILDKFPKKK